mgnify:CR=1 FL=1
MAVVYGANRSKVMATPAIILSPGMWGGRLKVAMDTYSAASLPAGSTIVTVRVPKGAVVVSGYVAYSALGTGTKVSVGNSSVADKYLGATSTTAAGLTHLNKVDALGVRLNEDEDIVLTISGGEATGTITVCVVYVSE